MSAQVKKIKIACLQVNAGDNIDKNLKAVFAGIRRAAKQKAALCCLPEMFAYRGKSAAFREVAENIPGPLIRTFQECARENRMAIALGSILEKSLVSGKYYNTSVLISEQGKIVARYRKIHLFEIKAGIQVSESKNFLPGKELVIAKLAGIKIGLTVCFDVRFPEQFSTLTRAGAQLILMPANFTDYTGRAHWEILLRARAIENQVYIAAAAQAGVSPGNKVKSHGNSMIVSPWGEILARAGCDRPELIIGEINTAYINEVRKKLPLNRK